LTKFTAILPEFAAVVLPTVLAELLAVPPNLTTVEAQLPSVLPDVPWAWPRSGGGSR